MFFFATISLKASSLALIGSIPQRLIVDAGVNGVSRTSQAAIVSRFTAGNRYICAGLHVPLHVPFSVLVRWTSPDRLAPGIYVCVCGGGTDARSTGSRVIGRGGGVLIAVVSHRRPYGDTAGPLVRMEGEPWMMDPCRVKDVTLWVQ